MGAVKEALKPAYHAVRDAAVRAQDAYGERLSARSETDYRKVVLSCNFGRGYLCNPKYIAEALNRLYPGEFDIVLLVQHHDNSLPAHLRQVRYGSRAAQRELATARFWIYNFRNDAKHVPKRDDQVYIQTWHGAIGPKRVEADVEGQLSQGYVSAARYDGSITNLMFSNNSLYERIFALSFWYDGPVLRCGVPRNRPLVLGDPGVRRHVRRGLGVPEEAALCLYAPTFRADGSMESYRFDYAALLDALEHRFGRRFCLAYRLHPNIADGPRPDFLEGLLDASAYMDTQELLAACDVVVSDYSSVLEDFMLTGRPGFAYAPDIARYVGERGFYYPLSGRPFPLSTNEGELLGSVRAYDEERQRSAAEDFCTRVGLRDDGHGDELLARVIKRLAERESTVSDVVAGVP